MFRGQKLCNYWVTSIVFKLGNKVSLKKLSGGLCVHVIVSSLFLELHITPVHVTDYVASLNGLANKQFKCWQP